MSEWNKIWGEAKLFEKWNLGKAKPWMERVKAEGDKLKEKAEKWDNLDCLEAKIERLAAYVNEDSGEAIEIILEAVENRLDEADVLERKLDEANHAINTVHGHSSDCDGRKDGFTCPVRAYLEVEVLE